MNKCILLVLAACGSALTAQQQLLLPFHHHLSESGSQSNGGASIFRTTAGRFQVLYEAVNFTNAGVAAPITLTKLRLRSEDTESNQGGQSYANVTVQLGSTSLSASAGTLSTVWATNWAPVAPNTTTPGPIGSIANLPVAASLGTAPNNYCIEIDLAAAGASITFDPTSAEPNLLIEVIMPSAPVNTIGPIIAIQDTTGTAAQLGGSCRTSAIVGGTSGVTISPPVINVEFTGAGGYGALVPARVESYGAGCGGSPSAFYQLFPHNEAFDMAGTGMTLTPDNLAAPNTYLVTAGTSAPFDASKVNATANSIVDEGVVTHPLGFTFNFPGGSTTDIKASTNGFAFLDILPAVTNVADFSPTLVEFLGNTVATPHPARLAPCWHDFHAGRNTVTHPNSGLHVLTDTTGGVGNSVCYVTWFNVGRFNGAAGGHSVNNVQLAIFEATGAVEFRYGTMSVLAGGFATGGNVTAITGFSRGQIAGVNSLDPQSRDLSIELPFATQVEGAANHIGLVAVQAATVPPHVPGRMFAGQSITWNALNVPVGSLLGAQLVDLAATRPGLQLPGITAPGCMLSTSTGAVLWELFLAPAGTVTGTAPFVVPGGYNPNFLGAEVYAQFVVLDGLFGGPNLITGASTSLKHTVGLQ